MDTNDFKHTVMNGSKTEYVNDQALEFLKDTAEFRVIERSALEKSDIEQDALINIALSSSSSKYSDSELIERVKNMLVDGSRDIQKYQLRDGGNIPNTIEIWRHDNGFSAFAFSE